MKSWATAREGSRGADAVVFLLETLVWSKAFRWARNFEVRPFVH